MRKCPLGYAKKVPVWFAWIEQQELRLEWIGEYRGFEHEAFLVYEAKTEEKLSRVVDSGTADLVRVIPLGPPARAFDDDRLRPLHRNHAERHVLLAVAFVVIQRMLEARWQ